MALLATWYLARRRPFGRTPAGLISGVGVGFLLAAIPSRHPANPMSPWVWLLAGLLFVLLGVAAYVLSGMRRRSR